MSQVRDRLAAVCESALLTLPIDGALIALTSRFGVQAVVFATKELFERLDECQVTAGQGPAVEAFAEGLSVLADDLGTLDAARRWPTFAPVARDADVSALFALPLRIGVIRVGVLSLYRRAAGCLTDDELARALRLADSASYAMLGLFAEDGSGPDGPEDVAVIDRGAADELYRVTVHQASGMVMVQLNVSIDEALARMRAYSFAEDVPLGRVAHAIVARSLRLQR